MRRRWPTTASRPRYAVTRSWFPLFPQLPFDDRRNHRRHRLARTRLAEAEVLTQEIPQGPAAGGDQLRGEPWPAHRRHLADLAIEDRLDLGMGAPCARSHGFGDAR